MKKNGSLILKRMVQHAIDRLLEDRITIKTSLPAQGIVTITRQEKRYIVHLLYGAPVRRGRNTEVIEDILPIYNCEIWLNIKENIKGVYLAPQNIYLEYTKENEKLHIIVPKLDLHQMVVLEY